MTHRLIWSWLDMLFMKEKAERCFVVSKIRVGQGGGGGETRAAVAAKPPVSAVYTYILRSL